MYGKTITVVSAQLDGLDLIESIERKKRELVLYAADTKLCIKLEYNMIGEYFVTILGLTSVFQNVAKAVSCYNSAVDTLSGEKL